MNKKKWLKLVFVVLFIIIAGILYSCRVGNKDEVTVITGTEESIPSEGNVDSTKAANTISSDGIKASEDPLLDKALTDDTDVTKDININTVDNAPGNSSESEKSSDYIYVHICGEVLKPNVYKVTVNTRVYEVIAKAGGLTEAAADSYINQASIVSDGQQIFIPSIEEVADKLPAAVSNVSANETTENSNSNNTGIININIATTEELMTLSGVGQAKAKAIIDYRINIGGFKSIDEIKNIDGIKDAVYNKIKDKITVD
ncbi:MAG: competence protein ComEA helix-hairpin-helix repeat region [Anaerocolumna sp.]|jgi:competence protein ComEA|nr:competence protein ComEA helix-hairpin-helix repeat region [Anaerocolumna sp.]